MEITIDCREDISGIGRILAERYKLNVVRKQLPVGDIIINDQIIIERKTSLDFIQSLIDGRLFRQARQMKKAYQNGLLVIEGKDVQLLTSHCHPHAIKGALISLGLSWQIPTLFSEDHEDTALLIWLMSQQSIPPLRAVSMRPGRRPKILYRKQLYLLQELPGVGATLAIRLLDRFKSVEGVMQAAACDLAQVKCLGRKKAEGIRTFLGDKIAS